MRLDSAYYRAVQSEDSYYKTFNTLTGGVLLPAADTGPPDLGLPPGASNNSPLSENQVGLWSIEAGTL